MIFLLSILIVIAVGAFYAGYCIGHCAGYADKATEDFDWSAWEEKMH